MNSSASFIFVLIAVWGSEPAAVEAAEEDENKPMRVMTFNIRYNNPADGANAWPHRRDAVAALITEKEIDIAGFQEALPEQIADLAERLPQYAWYGVGRDDGKSQGEFVPIFYRKDRFEVRDRGVFWLSESPDEPGSKSWDAAITRVTTWLELLDRTSDQPLFVFNTHFDHRGEEARAASAELLLSKIQELTNAEDSAAGMKTAAVVTGDFNCRPEELPYQIITGKSDRSAGLTLADALEVSREPHRGPLSTWNGFQAIDPRLRIDYIFVNDPVQVLTHRILTDQHEGRFLSDHLPIVADVLITAP